jgi:hypothetical protein
MAEVLKAAGYATACIGKWHLGDQPEFLPTAQGFDTTSASPIPTTWARLRRLQEQSWPAAPQRKAPKAKRAKKPMANLTKPASKATPSRRCRSRRPQRRRTRQSRRTAHLHPPLHRTGGEVHPRKSEEALLPLPPAQRRPLPASTRTRITSANPASACKKTGCARWTGPSARCSTPCVS